MVRDVCCVRADIKDTTVATAEREFIIRRSTSVNIEAVAPATRNMDAATLLNLEHLPERLGVSEAHRNLFGRL
jgi:hypothetical protein